MKVFETATKTSVRVKVTSSELAEALGYDGKVVGLTNEVGGYLLRIEKKHETRNLRLQQRDPKDTDQ